MNLGEYRNPQVIKSEVRDWHKHLETLTDIKELRAYGQGKEALSTVLRWVNEDIKCNIGKSDIVAAMQADDVPPDLFAVLKGLVSKDLRESPTRLQPMPQDDAQAEVEAKVENLLFDFVT